MDAGLEQRLGEVVRARVPGCEGLQRCERLSGGASQETYRLTVEPAYGERLLAMRRAPGGSLAEDHGYGVSPGLAAEARLMRLAGMAGVPEPEVLHVFEEADGLGEGFIMGWVEGEALGARIARAPEFENTRETLAFQCGVILARIHAIDVAETGLDRVLAKRTPEASIVETWERYRSLDTFQPMIDYTARWLLENLPRNIEYGLVHSDFRNGNFLVRPDEGIVAVLDWELAHIGDPMRDLGWLCNNAWRFGVTDLPVGGFGRREDLFEGYASVTGVPVDPARVKFWEVFGSFWWAVTCLDMVRLYREGTDTSLERPAVGTRSSEAQVDCVNALIPGPVEGLDDGAPPGFDMPSAEDLLLSVRDFLRDDIAEGTQGRTRFLARVAANSLDVVLRGQRLSPRARAFERESLKRLLNADDDDLDTLKRRLCEGLRDGSVPLGGEDLETYLRQSVVNRVAIDQPGYSGYRTATAKRKREGERF